TKPKRKAAVGGAHATKKVSSLVNKWKAAKEELDEERMRREQEEEERERALYDGEVIGKERQKKIEEWKQQQLQTGEAEENANFQPLAVDWRERVKRARGANQAQADSPLLNGAGAATAAATPAATAGSATGDDEQSRQQGGGPAAVAAGAAAVAAATAAVAVGAGAKKKRKGTDLKALSAGLPAAWQAFLDPQSNEVYYGNLSTNETSWDRPV
ncbi:unnamed protein product, partial [Closterium sp. NIES-65]